MPRSNSLIEALAQLDAIDVRTAKSRDVGAPDAQLIGADESDLGESRAEVRRAGSIRGSR